MLPNRQNECVSFLNECSALRSTVRALFFLRPRLSWLQHQEAALSDEHENAAGENAAATTVDVGALQAQLKSVTADRDRQAFEKSEIVTKANAISRERDGFRERLDAAVAERDRLAAERDKLAAEASGATRSLAEATRRADEATAEVARLRKAIEAGPSNDPLILLWAVITQKTKTGVAFLRSKIPENHPALPWFDKTVETATKTGCLAVQFGVAFAKWAKDWALPRAKELLAKLMSEIEARLEKK